VGAPTDVFSDAKQNDSGSILYPYVLIVEFSLKTTFGPERESKSDAQKDSNLSPLEGIPEALLTARYRNTYLAGKNGIRLSKAELQKVGDASQRWEDRPRWPDACWDRIDTSTEAAGK